VERQHWRLDRRIERRDDVAAAGNGHRDRVRARPHLQEELVRCWRSRRIDQPSQGAREPIAAIVRTVFAQPDHATAMAQLRKVADGLRGRFARTATLLEDAAEDVLAYRLFPHDHQRQLHSTNVLERLNKEIKRRSNVVGIFPTPAAAIRLIGALLLEQDDEWAVAERRYFSAESIKLLSAPAMPTSAHDLLAAIV
jgi:transposase-like protein